MMLIPRGEPGRAHRKAHAFQLEIRRLRTVGYSFGQIRQALADAGVVVSISTVRREALSPPRRLPRPEVPPEAGEDLSAAAPMPAWHLVTEQMASEQRCGKDIAQAFVSGRITNPLIRARLNDEDRRH